MASSLASLNRRGLTRLGRLCGRVLLWSAVALVFANGAVALVRNVTGGGARSDEAGAEAPTFPEGAASAFAARFAHAYLNYDARSPTERQNQLQAYLAEGVDPLAGWDGAGEQTAVNTIPVDVDVLSDRLAVVTVAVNVTGPRWLYLGVPVAADGERLAVTGAPALVPAPERAAIDADELTDVGDTDGALASQLRPTLTSFLRAYGSGSAADLAYFLRPGREVRGLGGAVRLGALQSLRVSTGGARRSAVAAVRWVDRTTGAGLTQTYHVELVEQGGRWYVDSVGAAPGHET